MDVILYNGCQDANYCGAHSECKVNLSTTPNTHRKPLYNIDNILNMSWMLISLGEHYEHRLYVWYWYASLNYNGRFGSPLVCVQETLFKTVVRQSNKSFVLSTE